MALSTATVTGKIGPNQSLTAQVFTDVSVFTLDCLKRTVTLVTAGKTVDVDISAQTTLTVTGVSTGLFVITVS